MNGLAACSGVGGLELGLAAAIPDYRTVCYVERNSYCAATLVARMADQVMDRTPIWDDLSTFDGMQWRGCVDIISAGFPCQPFSLAGQCKGTEDERWLWPDILRIIREVGPSLVFLENVPALVPHGLHLICGGLAELGFDAEWGVFSAAEVGAPHLRKRFFMLASHPDRLLIREQPRGSSGQGRSNQAQLADHGAAQPLAHANSRGQQEQRGSSVLDGQRDDVDGRSWWATEPDVGRVANGVAFWSHRLHALGNAVVPQCATKAYLELEARYA